MSNLSRIRFLKTELPVAVLSAIALSGGLAISLAGCSREGKDHVTGAASASDTRHTSESASGEGGISVQTAVPRHSDLTRQFEQPAPIVAYEKAMLHQRVSGYVRGVLVDIGTAVPQGKVLMTLEAPDLQQDLIYKQALTKQAEAEAKQADAAVHSAEADLLAWNSQVQEAEAEIQRADSDRKYRKRHAQRFAELGAKEAVPSDLVEEKRDQATASEAAYQSGLAKRNAIEARKASLVAKLEGARAERLTRQRKVEVSKADEQRAQLMVEYMNLRAPFAGVITKRSVDPGDYVTAGASREPLFVLERLDKLTAVLKVPEREAGNVRVGMKARVRLESRGGKAVPGTVARFSKSLDEKSRTMRVEIDIDNPDGAIYPGMYGSIDLILQESKNALAIPASAVYSVGNKTYVVVVRDNHAHRVPVEIGYDDGKVVQVLSGLSGDEQVIVSNKGQISEGQAVEPHRAEQL